MGSLTMALWQIRECVGESILTAALPVLAIATALYITGDLWMV